MFDIITIGSSVRDVFLSEGELKTVKGDQFPTGEGFCAALGSKIEIHKLAFASGGGGTNAAVTFARQGFSVSCIGVVGNDMNGKEIVAELQREGVDTSYFQTHTDDYTAYSVILVHPSGERSILSYKGEGQHFDAASIPFDKLETKWLYLDSMGGYYDLLAKTVAWAVGRGVKVAINPGSKELAHGIEKLQPVFKHVSFLMMNQEEAAGLTGIDYQKETEIFKRMDELISGIFVFTKGSGGVMVSDGKNVYSAGVPDSPVVERTGAGDAFNAGFIAEYIRQTDNLQRITNNEEAIVKAIQFGTANATSVVEHFGAKEGILKEGDMGKWPVVEVRVEPLAR